MPQGVCPLCLQTKDLRDSHLLAKSYYKLARKAGDKNPNPVVVGGDVAIKTSKQVTAYLLCADCEHRFNTAGEKWVIENGWKSVTDFPIHAALAAAQPVYAGADLKVYAGNAINGIDPDKLGYFAASVFWRAAAHKWKVENSDDPIFIDLGPYTEELRVFLMGGAFPPNAAIIVTANSSPSVVLNEFALFPFDKARTTTHRQYKFLVPGLGFELFTGKGLPSSVRQMCIIRSAERKLFISPKMEEQTLNGMAELAGKAKKIGNTQ